MDIRVTVVKNDISKVVSHYSAEMGKTVVEATRMAAKGATRRVIELTPPAHEGVTGAAAYRFARQKINRDLRKVLVPVQLKGRREITHVFGRELVRPVVVQTTEIHPDVAGVYRQNSRMKNVGVGASSRDLGTRKYWVDTRKFSALLKSKESRIGRMASGWAAGAMALDVPLQQWISRHGPANGRVVIRTSSASCSILVENFAEGVPDNVRAELRRRIPYAIQYQAAAMERAIRGRAERLARRGS